MGGQADCVQALPADQHLQPHLHTKWVFWQLSHTASNPEPAASVSFITHCLAAFTVVAGEEEKEEREIYDKQETDPLTKKVADR